MFFNGNAFSVVPFVTFCSIWEIVRTVAETVFLFEKFDVFLIVLIFLELTVDTVLTILKVASPKENRVNILL